MGVTLWQGLRRKSSNVQDGFGRASLSTMRELQNKMFPSVVYKKTYPIGPDGAGHSSVNPKITYVVVLENEWKWVPREATALLQC